MSVSAITRRRPIRTGPERFSQDQSGNLRDRAFSKTLFPHTQSEARPTAPAGPTQRFATDLIISPGQAGKDSAKTDAVCPCAGTDRTPPLPLLACQVMYRAAAPYSWTTKLGKQGASGRGRQIDVRACDAVPRLMVAEART